MSTRRFVQELEYQRSLGVDTTTPLSNMQPGYVRQASNCNLTAAGEYEKRQGYEEQLTSAWTGFSIRNATELRLGNGSVERIFLGTNDLNESKIGKESAGSIVDSFSPTMAVEERIAFVQYSNRILCFNGNGFQFVYEGGTATRAIGILGPDDETPPTASQATDGDGALAPGDYLVSYTYILRNTTTGEIVAESTPAALASTSVSDPNNAIEMITDAIDLAGYSVPAPFETRIRKYRTTSGGDTLFLDVDMESSAGGTVTFIKGDTTLQVNQLPLGNFRLSQYTGYGDSARFPQIVRNRLFVAHEEKNEIRYSTITSDGPLIESFPATSFVNCDGRWGAADQIVGIGQAGDVPMVFKEQSIGRLEEIGSPELAVTEDAVLYLYRELSDTIGAVSHFSQCRVFNELIWLGPDNIYATDGRQIRSISDPIQNTIRNLNLTSSIKTKLSMINDTQNRRIYLTVPKDASSTEPDLVIVGDYYTYPNFRWTFYEQGTDNTTHPGIRAGCFMYFTDTVSGAVETYFGNTDTNGQYYKMNTGDNDNGNGIFFKIISRPYAIEQPLLTKLFKKARIFAEAQDDTYDLRFCSIYDLNTVEVFCRDFSIPAFGARWENDGEDPLYGWANDDGELPVGATADEVATWAGVRLAELSYNPHRKGKFMQLVLEQTDADAPVKILGWGISGSIFGGI